MTEQIEADDYRTVERYYRIKLIAQKLIWNGGAINSLV